LKAQDHLLALIYYCRWLFTRLTQATQLQNEFGKMCRVSIVYGVVLSI